MLYIKKKIFTTMYEIFKLCSIQSFKEFKIFILILKKT